MCYPQQLGRSWKVFVPEPSRTLFAMCTGTFRNLISHRRNLTCNLRRSPPEPHRPCAPELSGTSSAICTGTRRNFVCYAFLNPPEPCLLSAPEPSGTSSAICTRTRRNLICAGTICTGTRRNFVCYVYRNTPEPHQPSPEPYPEPHQLSAPEPAGTCRNLVCYLHRNHPEPSGSSSAICGGTVRNLISFLHRNPGTFRNPPEPSPEPRVAAAPDRTRVFLG